MTPDFISAFRDFLSQVGDDLHCEKQDINHVVVCGSSANCPAKNLRKARCLPAQIMILSVLTSVIDKKHGPVVDSNEAMCCEYISTILHTIVSLLDGLVIAPQMNITVRVIYDEVFDTILQIYSTSRTEYRILLTEDALEDPTK
ncbi:hypothetical protein GLOIN_2v1530555 [Rhizophagus clarus]|uniref:Uncharacterized protein n=1 Tax=Rhizophagus clarus TaxID=94130 RepID=A0A8H3LRT0_9GLOM|nr:hypothetical protein GLOIN_2v1530555 [Rhizophagus clarus]